ncbi:amidase [Alsobacter metallidurans]|uniref:Amidase n=1 Tax=Alsobacter metallidurans TaxID=340221 RepID=A0A917I6W2_9HYPH|nr:amidase family protein [Alsobacter metallidurans]GGH17540.1 amidase [Alsobacter metallidurans]
MLSIIETRRRIEAGELAPAAAVEAAMAAAKARNGDLKAFASFASDSAAAPGAGPLAGVAVGVKDIIDTADLPTEMGCAAIFGGWRPRADAAIVDRVRELGGSIIGKTETTAFAYLDPAPTLNPHDAARTPGGSSAGSAAAVAAGLIPLAIGTQTAGSVIRPASFCGVAAIKPSFRLLPTVGAKTTAWTLDTLGLFAAAADDLAYALAAISGRDMAFGDDPAGLRFGVSTMPHAGERSPESEAALERAASALAAQGASVTQVTLPGALVEADRLQPTIYQYELHASLGWEWRTQRAAIPPGLAAALAAGEAVSTDDYDRARGAARRARNAAKDLFAEVDVLLTLSAPGPAPARATTGEARFNRLFTLLGTPCVNVPGLRASDGMPIGIQIVAPFARDSRALAAARLLELAIKAL